MAYIRGLIMVRILKYAGGMGEIDSASAQGLRLFLALEAHVFPPEVTTLAFLREIVYKSNVLR